MSSRLDRLFTLLSTSSSPSARHLAARQLGEVQRLHPHELHSLLTRLHPLLRSTFWDTRIAASKALAAILKEVPPCDENFPNDEAFTFAEENLALLTWEKVEEHGKANQVILTEQDDETTAGSEEQLRRINAQLGLDVASKLGFMDANDIISNEDLADSKRPSDGAASSLSSREKNILRRKQKAELKRNSSRSSVEEKGQNKKAKLSSTRNGFGPLYTYSGENEEVEMKGVFPLGKFCDCLAQDLFHSSWEVRHGAATALREILKLQGSGGGKRLGLTPRENQALHSEWLSRFCIKLLWVISTDRFGDFVADEMIAPVRESSAMALGAILAYMSDDAVKRVIQMLLTLIQHEDWQSRHGGVLGLKHFLAMSKSQNVDLVLKSIYPAICSRLSDDMDDVVSAASAALLPVVSRLTNAGSDIKIEPGLDSLARQLSNILVGLDELSASTQSVMRLLDHILFTISLSARSQPFLSCDELSTLVHRLLPFLHNSSSIVRLSSLKTLSASIITAQNNPEFMTNVSHLLLPHLFQRALLENKSESLDLVENIWSQVCELCPLQRLLLAGCPVYGSWFALIQKPSNHPLPAEFLLPFCSSASNWQYLGGPVAQNMTDEKERNRLATRARCLCARMLGKLACYIAMPAPGIDYSREPSTPIEMFVEKVLLPSMQCRSAFKHTALGLVVVYWSDSNPRQIADIPNVLKEKLMELLITEDHYEETGLAFSELSLEVSNFGSKLVKVFGSSLSSEQLHHIPTLPIEAMCREKKVAAKLTKELIARQSEISATTQRIQNDEKLLDILAKGCLASALVGIEAIPDKLNPVIKPLMESIKRETNLEILCIVAKKLAKLLDICLSKGNVVASEKVIRNLMHFAASDPDVTPLIQANPDQVELGIISLERAGTKQSSKQSSKSASSDPSSSTEAFSVSLALQTQCRGSSEALKAIVRHFGEGLLAKLPMFGEWTLGAVREAQGISVQDLLISLRTLEICVPCFPDSLLDQLETGLTSLASLLCHNLAPIRHISARCLASLATLIDLRIPVISLLVDKVIPFLGSELPHYRQGAIESLSSVIDILGIEIVPYIVLLIIPILGRMSDQDNYVRQMASGTFATLIKLIPLDSSDNSYDKLPEQLAAKKAVDRKFVEELMNIKNIEDYPLDIPINAELRSYQKEGINWLAFLSRYGLHGILCDDMGLGKTLQSICILAGNHHKRRKDYAATGLVDSSPLPSLVICPATLCGHWKAEIEQFVDSDILQPFVYNGTMQSRQELRSPIRKLARQLDNLVLISSYEIVRNDLAFLAEFHWNYLILDEGHSIRNTKAKTTVAVKTLRANHRLILSGTPIQNSVLELWSLFDFLMPGFLGTERQFSSRYSRPIIASRGTGTTTSVSRESQEAGALAMEALHRQVLPFVLRRIKDDVLKDLPPKITQDYYCDLSPVQVMLYEDFAQKQKDAVLSGGSDQNRIRTHVFQALQYLRKVCNHPKLVLHPQHEQYAEVQKWLSDNNTNLESISNAAKLPALKQLLLECNIGAEKESNDLLDAVVNQHRVLLFCQLKSMMDIVETDLLKQMPNVTYLRLDGSVPANFRMSLVNRFNADPSIDVFLLSTSVGGLGLNLTGADIVIFVEHDWNPMKDLQAMDRAHRIGQKKVVNVYRLITRNTVEEKIMGLQKFKLKTANTVISKDNSSLESMGKEQIFELFSLENSNKKSSRKEQTSGSGMRSVLDNLPELWDESQYEDEFSMGEV